MMNDGINPPGSKSLANSDKRATGGMGLISTKNQFFSRKGGGGI